MEPFNIRIPVENQQLTITILPADENVYKVVYYGAILGAIRREPVEQTWLIVPMEELTAGDLPFYQKGLHSDRLDFDLDAETIEVIGTAIETEIRGEKSVNI
jgi:hypothetical protein